MSIGPKESSTPMMKEGRGQGSVYKKAGKAGSICAGRLFRDEAGRQAANDAVARMIKRAIALDGTCTGEHGVGVGKRKYLYEELGEGTVELMKTIKRAIDPLNLFNPGKVR